MTSAAEPRKRLPRDVLNKLAGPIVAAAENAHLGISVSVVEGDSVRRIYVSDVAAKLLGYSAEELIGSSTYLTYAPEEVERMCGLSQQWRTGGWIPHFLETVVVRKDGTRVPRGSRL